MTSFRTVALALWTTGSLLTLAARPASGQPSPYRIQQLAPGVHLAIRDVGPGHAADSNVLIIINDRDVVVVDANIFPSSARQMIAEIRKLTPKPVRYLINTHWHSDHHYGNQVYREAFPGVEIVAHPVTRELILTRDIPDLAVNVDSAYPAEIRQMTAQLRNGKSASGQPLTENQRIGLRAALGDYQFFVKDMTVVKPSPPTLTVADSLVLHRGERTIAIRHLGRGNTPGDLVVHLPKERIVATGDLVVHPTPFAFEVSLREWPTTLEALKRLDATQIVPGHGEVERDWQYVDALIGMFRSTWEQVERAVKSGADLEGVKKAVNVDEFRSRFGSGKPTDRQAFDGLYLNPAIESAYNQLRKGG